MNAKEMLKQLAELGVMYIQEEKDGRYYVEDSESYRGYAYISFDENGNCVKVEK